MKSRIPELDGLRGVAILLVVLFHYGSMGKGPPLRSALYEFSALFRMGWAGVDLFFVLSGFLIGGILMDSRGSPTYYSKFYLRRGLRILPLYFLWIALYPLALVLFGRWIALLRDYEPVLDSIPYYVTFLQSFRLPQMLSFAFYWFCGTWSLAVEEQFYLGAAPLVRWSTDRAIIAGTVIIICVSPFIRILARAHWGPWVSYVLMFCRADSLSWGVLIAALWRKHRDWLIAHKRAVSVALVLIALPAPIFLKWYYSALIPLAASVTFSWLAMLFAGAILLVLVNPQSLLAQFARSGILREFGRLSYCIYLIHLVVFALAHAIILHRNAPSVEDWRGAAVTAVAFGTTYLIAWASMRYFEGPLLRMAHKTQPVPIEAYETR